MRKKLLVLLMAVFASGAYAQESGVNEITGFNKMSLLRTDVLSFQQSSHDPTGGNDDGYTKGNFPDTYNGENVMLRAVGKGVVTRIWLTGYGMSDRIKIYFDGETEASVNETIAGFFSGKKAPYLSPLVVNDEVSSGGFFSYMPFPFEESVMITTTGNHYYNINYQLYENNNEEISTWTGDEDLTDVYNIFNNKGSDPRSNPGYTTIDSIFNLNKGDTKSAVTIQSSNKSTGNVLLKIPGLEFTNIFGEIITDNGRATVGNSQFTVNIDSAATNVVLIRRIDYFISNQKAKIYIDGEYAGEWFTQGGNSSYRWLNAEFKIPSEFTAGKSKITVKTEFVSSLIDWNEFYYWVKCDSTLTDEIDVGNGASENAHNYTISPLNWSGSLSSRYPPGSLSDEDMAVVNKNSNILKNVNLQIYFDGETTPSVDAPVGLFFGMGTINAIKFQSLPVGVTKTTDQMYCYFPMPFKNSFELKLVNNSDYDLSDVDVTVKYEDLPSGMSEFGYFKTQYNKESPTTSGNDYIFLDETGTGKFVGLVIEAFDGYNDSWLEGDERFYIDGCRTPALYGTGTEDYFNGAWYFSRGPFHLATHGFTTASKSDRSLYRFHLSEPVCFTNRAKFGIEHGPANDVNINYHSLAFYYHRPESKLKLTDELILGDSQSEQSHNYNTSDSRAETGKMYYFEGDNDRVPVKESGYYIKGTSEFTVKVTPGKPVRIKRMFDYKIKNQTAGIYIDGALVGTWYTNGSNSFKRWREEFFMIPAEFTKGKSEITIKIEAPVNEYKWSEFHYWIYTSDVLSVAAKEFKKNNPLLYPNPANNFIMFRNSGMQIKSVEIMDINGKSVKTFLSFNPECRIEISDLIKGLYFARIHTDDSVFVEKFIKE